MTSKTISPSSIVKILVNPNRESLKALLKFMCDDDLDPVIDEALQIGAVLFSIGIYIIVTRTLIRNSQRYSEMFSSTDTEKEFKNSKTLKSLKEMLISYYSSASTSKSKEQRECKKRLFAELESDDEQTIVHESVDESMAEQQQLLDEVDESRKKKNKKVKK